MNTRMKNNSCAGVDKEDDEAHIATSLKCNPVLTELHFVCFSFRYALLPQFPL